MLQVVDAVVPPTGTRDPRVQASGSAPQLLLAVRKTQESCDLSSLSRRYFHNSLELMELFVRNIILKYLRNPKSKTSDCEGFINRKSPSNRSPQNAGEQRGRSAEGGCFWWTVVLKTAE